MIRNAFRHQNAKVLPVVDAYRIAIKRRKSARPVARRGRPSKYRHRNVCSRVQRRRKQTDGYRPISGHCRYEDFRFLVYAPDRRSRNFSHPAHRYYEGLSGFVETFVDGAVQGPNICTQLGSKVMIRTSSQDPLDQRYDRRFSP